MDASHIAWSPRVPRHQIRRLYDGDAQGLLDQDLLDEVGWAIFARCRDILDVAAALEGTVRCRRCGNPIERRRAGEGPVGDKGEILHCGRCSWQITWGDYHRSLLGRGLMADGAERPFAPFVERWPLARSPQERMLLIDRLIHEFHVVQFGLGRCAAVNVIEGTEREVAALIAGLATGPQGTPGLADSRALWAARLGATERRLTVTGLRVIARELGIAGAARMRKRELMEAIERVDPRRLTPLTR